MGFFTRISRDSDDGDALPPFFSNRNNGGVRGIGGAERVGPEGEILSVMRGRAGSAFTVPTLLIEAWCRGRGRSGEGTAEAWYADLRGVFQDS